MKNMDDYRFQNELEYQLALLESIRKLLLVYEKFYQEETKGDMLPRIGGSILSHQELTRTLQKSHPEFWNHKKEALQELSRIRKCGKKSMQENGIRPSDCRLHNFPQHILLWCGLLLRELW